MKTSYKMNFTTAKGGGTLLESVGCFGNLKELSQM